MTHTAEISYVFMKPTFVFGRPQHPERCAFNRSEAAFASFVGGIWTAFARSGVPHGAWPRYGLGLGGGGEAPREADVAVVLKRADDVGNVTLAWRAAECVGWAP